MDVALKKEKTTLLIDHDCYEGFQVEQIERPYTIYKIDGLLLPLPMSFKM